MNVPSLHVVTVGHVWIRRTGFAVNAGQDIRTNFVALVSWQRLLHMYILIKDKIVDASTRWFLSSLEPQG